jgi:hypothetical protein
MWQAADQAILLPSVEVIPWEDALALLPAESPQTQSVLRFRRKTASN